jgi:hypothetical protein
VFTVKTKAVDQYFGPISLSHRRIFGLLAFSKYRESIDPSIISKKSPDFSVAVQGHLRGRSCLQSYALVNRREPGATPETEAGPRASKKLHLDVLHWLPVQTEEASQCLIQRSRYCRAKRESIRRALALGNLAYGRQNLSGGGSLADQRP